MNKDTKLIFEAYKQSPENEAHIIDLMIELRVPQSLPALDKLGEFEKRIDSGEMDYPEFDELVTILNDNDIEYEQYDKVFNKGWSSLMIRVNSEQNALQALSHFRGQFANIGSMRTKMETGEPETMDDLEEHTHGPHIYVTEDGRKVSISAYKEDE
tara:strand:- start:470 stop:937 length:468 start_codon:yes stop_codon:yes gene_type:complete